MIRPKGLPDCDCGPWAKLKMEIAALRSLIARKVDKDWPNDEGKFLKIVNGEVSAAEVEIPEITVDDALSSVSENPVQNKIIYDALQNIEIDVDDALSPISENPVQNKVIYNALQGAGSKITSVSSTAYYSAEEMHGTWRKTVDVYVPPVALPSSGIVWKTDVAGHATLSYEEYGEQRIYDILNDGEYIYVDDEPVTGMPDGYYYHKTVEVYAQWDEETEEDVIPDYTISVALQQLYLKGDYSTELTQLLLTEADKEGLLDTILAAIWGIKTSYSDNGTIGSMWLSGSLDGNTTTEYVTVPISSANMVRNWSKDYPNIGLSSYTDQRTSWSEQTVEGFVLSGNTSQIEFGMYNNLLTNVEEIDIQSLSLKFGNDAQNGTAKRFASTQIYLDSYIDTVSVENNQVTVTLSDTIENIINTDYPTSLRVFGSTGSTPSPYALILVNATIKGTPNINAASYPVSEYLYDKSSILSTSGSNVVDSSGIWNGIRKATAFNRVPLGTNYNLSWRSPALSLQCSSEAIDPTGVTYYKEKDDVSTRTHQQAATNQYGTDIAYTMIKRNTVESVTLNNAYKVTFGTTGYTTINIPNYAPYKPSAINNLKVTIGEYSTRSAFFIPLNNYIKSWTASTSNVTVTLTKDIGEILDEMGVIQSYATTSLYLYITEIEYHYYYSDFEPVVRYYTQNDVFWDLINDKLSTPNVATVVSIINRGLLYIEMTFSDNDGTHWITGTGWNIDNTNLDMYGNFIHALYDSSTGTYVQDYTTTHINWYNFPNGTLIVTLPGQLKYYQNVTVTYSEFTAITNE